MSHYYFGLDLGQKRDHSAVAVVECAKPVLARFDYVRYLYQPVCLDPVYGVRHLRRFPLGMSYPAIVAQIRDLTRRPEVKGKSTLVVDGTGVGAAVLDLLLETDLGCDVVPVSITGGAGATRDGRWWHVPKRDLIGVVQVLIEQNRLRFASGCPELGRLIEEFMHVRVKAGQREMQFGAWRSGRTTIWRWRSRWRAGGRKRASARWESARMGGCFEAGGLKPATERASCGGRQTPHRLAAGPTT